MTSPARAALLVALRDARRFDLPEPVFHDCLTAEHSLLDDPGRLAVAEGFVRGTLLDGVAISPAARASVSPALGNIAEAVIEVVLADQGWTPVYDDDGGSSSGHGVDLLMLDPAMERMVAIEVKSTVQAGRWPRLASGRREQLTPA